MSWATPYIAKLKTGESVQFRPRGNSMTPRIKSGDLVTVYPSSPPYQVGNIVLCKVNGRHYLHLISAIRDKQVQISNNHGRTNGWISFDSVYGKVAKIENGDTL